jgi:hypothetical protein
MEQEKIHHWLMFVPPPSNWRNPRGLVTKVEWNQWQPDLSGKCLLIQNVKQYLGVMRINLSKVGQTEFI